MRDQFDNYEKRIVEKLDREAEEIERRIEENPQAAEAKANESLDRKVYAGVAAYEEAVAGKNEVLHREAELEDILDKLSPNDAEALRLGWEVQRRLRGEEGEEEPKKTERKHAGVWKRLAAAVVVLVLVTGFGVNSMGGPTRIVEKVKLAIGGREISKVNSSTEEAKVTEEDAEKEAYQQIKDELGIDPVRLVKLPGNMKFKNCEIDTEICLAQVLYEYDGKNISYLIGDSYTKKTWGIDVEDEKIDEYTYEVDNIGILVSEHTLQKSKDKEYVAEFEYKEVYYQLTAVIKKAEFEKMLDFLHFY